MPVMSQKRSFVTSSSETTSFLVDTKGMCLLCYRRSRTQGQKRKTASSAASSRFCKLIFRHTKLNFKHNVTRPARLRRKLGKNGNVEIELCEDCQMIANAFCETYSQIDHLKMRLEFCVKTITEIIKVAGRIPSRVREFQSRMGSDKGTETTIQKRSILVAATLRKELTQKCLESLKLSLPRVHLNRVNTSHNATEQDTPSNESAMSLVVSTGQDKPAKVPAKLKVSTFSPGIKSASVMFPVALENFRNFLLAYAFSYGIVFYLLGLKYEGSAPSRQECIQQVCKDPTKCILEVNQCDCSPISVLQEEKATKSQEPAVPQHRNSITIVEDGKTVLLPHQTFKTDADEFVDESLMDDDVCDLAHMDYNSTLDTSASSSSDPIIILEPTEETNLEETESSCTECRIILSSRAEVEKHRVVIHKMLAYVRCSICKEMFESYQLLKCHRMENEKCAIDTEAERQELEQIARPIFPFSTTIGGNKFCPVEGCFEVFRNENTLKDHLKAHGSFSCEFCKTNFDKAHSLAFHESQQHVESGNQFSGYKCSRCNFVAGKHPQFIRHFLSSHLNIEVFKRRCPICQKGFTDNRKVLDIHHKLYHDTTGVDPSSVFKCNFCDAPFLKKTQLKIHQKEVHNIGVENGTVFTCSICSESFPKLVMVKIHKLKAHSASPEAKQELKRKREGKRGSLYECQCGKSYTSKFNLLLHQRIHEKLNQEMEKFSGQTDDNGTEATSTTDNESADSQVEASSSSH